MIAKLIHSRYVLWVLLALPAIPYLDELINPTRYYPEIMEQSGVLSVQLLVATLLITPLTLMLKPFERGKAISRWLLAKRKYFGLAAAAYAVIHTILYLRQIFWDVELAWLEALDLPFGSGWIALFLFLLVALVSNQWGIRKLGDWWKPWQRMSYIVAAAAFLHWYLLDFFIENLLWWAVPLLIGKTIHLALRQKWLTAGHN